MPVVTLLVRCSTLGAILIGLACSDNRSQLAGSPDDDVATPTMVRQIKVHGPADLVENSAAVMSASQPDVVFTINDSGNLPVLYALDVTGANRGRWYLTGATNVDWEAASLGPCATSDTLTLGVTGTSCLYIGDVGDNDEVRPTRRIYRVTEPVMRSGGLYAKTPEALSFRYADGPHDVEAMYVAPTGTTFLITKRRRSDATGRLRPALLFEVPAAAWGRDTLAVAQLVDSLPIVPGSARQRLITDASLSPDAQRLAVRTYAEVYVFATDSLTGRVRPNVPPARCNIANLERGYGEGITWYGTTTDLLLTREGLDEPMLVVRCPMPASDSTLR